MINPRNFVFSQAAAARILGVTKQAIVRFEIWYKVIFVIVEGCRPTFISKNKFKQHFVDWRKEQGKVFSVSRIKDNHFRVINHKKATMYSVYAFQEGLDCQCYDYQNQVIIFNNGKACCKHCYSVLNSLGFSSLHEYIDHHRWAS